MQVGMHVAWASVIYGSVWWGEYMKPTMPFCLFTVLLWYMVGGGEELVPGGPLLLEPMGIHLYF